MGADAIIIALTDHVWSDRDIASLSYRMRCVFASDWFAEKAIERLTQSEYSYNLSPEFEHERTLIINIRCRYWSPSYPRGPFDLIYSLLEWLNRSIQGRVFYCSDYQGRPDFHGDVYDEEMREALMEGAVHETNAFDIMPQADAPVCENCAGNPMIASGLAPSYKRFVCPACGDKKLVSYDDLP